MSERIAGPHICLTLDDRLELYRYMAFRTVRHLRDEVCTDSEAKKFLTRVMRRLKETG